MLYIGKIKLFVKLTNSKNCFVACVKLAITFNNQKIFKVHQKLIKILLFSDIMYTFTKSTHLD